MGKTEKRFHCDCNGTVKTDMASTTPRCPECGEKMKPDQDLTIEMFRQMVKDHRAQDINGFVVDVQTANAIVTVHDALKPESKAKFLSMPILNVANTAWSMVS